MGLKEDLIQRVVPFNVLPKQTECLQLMRIIENEEKDKWWAFCIERGMFVVPNKELVEQIIFLARRLRISEGIEIGAGNGKLSYWLNQSGLKIRPTDINPKAKYVEKLNAAEALQKYNPEIVLISFADDEELASGHVQEIIKKILDYPSVKFVIHLGNASALHRKEDAAIIESWGWKVEKLDLATYPTYRDSTADASYNALYKRNV